MSVSDFDELTGERPEKKLMKPSPSSGGRNVHGRTTMRHRGGGHKRRYRVVDFKRDKVGLPAKVISIQYDPNRSARLALLHYKDGEKRYILWPNGLEVGAWIVTSLKADIHVGNCMPLSEIPPGTQLHNIELMPGRGGQIVRSAGTSAQLMAKEGKHVLIRLPSGELRKVPRQCMATIGVVGNVEHSNLDMGKAGRSRWLGRRPKVRGVAMNPVDHPMGGGEGKSSGGRHPCTPWGKPTKGYKTRKKNKSSNALIVKPRKKK